MTENQAAEPEDEANEILSLEYFMENGEVDQARTTLRKILLRAGDLEGGNTIGDALSGLCKNPAKHRREAILLARCLAVQGIMPEPNATNQIVRLVVELCEAAIPDIVSFLKINNRSQNIEKYLVFADCQNRIETILDPLRVPYGDLTALLSARKEIVGCLNHSIIRQYAGPFSLKETRGTVESIFGHLKRMSEVSTSLLTDIEECHQSIEQAKSEIIATATFLSNRFLYPFLLTCEKAVASFVETLRGRFLTSISLGSGIHSDLQKRYPLHESGRELQIVIPLRNAGPGLATDLEITVTTDSDAVMLAGGSIKLGNVLPGEFSVVLDAMIISPCEKFPILLNVDWGEIGNPSRKTEVFEVNVAAQDSAVDWQSLQYQAPYSTDVAEGDQFFGRLEKVQFLSSKLLRQPMESFYVTGQKRVGKTSLALAATEYAKCNCQNGVLNYHYVLWGNIAHSDPVMSLQRLGESIEDFILRQIAPNKPPWKSDYNGSLSHLIQLANFGLMSAPQQRYVVVLDEFDEIHQELFLQGNLAETFFANLRALSRCKNVCIVLIGGENMPFVMERQGQKLNNFQRVNLNYFSRTSEWSDFQLIVKSPTVGSLNWHDDAVSEVFNITNGNPYFAKIVCASVFRQAVVERDADITANEVHRAIESAISAFGAHSFAHLWQDGVPKPISDRDPDILRRMRVLVALARCMRHGLETNVENIAANKTSEKLVDAEIPSVLNDFVRREVLKESDRLFAFGLPIFRMWLVDVGVSQLFADALNEELANVTLAKENAAVVRSEELVELARSWPTYRGKHVGTDEIRAWYQQVESLRDQRILFELLKRTRVFSEAHVRERLKAAHAFVRPVLPEFIQRKRNERRRDVLLTYIDGEGKSGAGYASTYAEENNIPAECVVSRSDFRARFAEHIRLHGKPAALVIIDDIAATGRSLSRNIRSFIDDYKDLLIATKVRIITLVATEAAQRKVLSEIDKIADVDLDFRSSEVLTSQDFAFPNASASEDEARAKALCVNLGSYIYPNDPLGFGGLGILVVFPTTVPNNSLPILHSSARTSSQRKWEPLFPRIVN
jgi:hypothetical protein